MVWWCYGGCDVLRWHVMVNVVGCVWYGGAVVGVMCYDGMLW